MKKFKVLVANRGEERFGTANFFCKMRYWEDDILTCGKNFIGLPDKYIMVIHGYKVVGTLAIAEKKVPAKIANFNPLNKNGFEIMRYSFNPKYSNGEKTVITKLLFKELLNYFDGEVDDYFIYMTTFSGVIAMFTKVSGIKSLFCETGIKITSMPNRSLGFLKKRDVKFYFINTRRALKYYQKT